MEDDWLENWDGLEAYRALTIKGAMTTARPGRGFIIQTSIWLVRGVELSLKEVIGLSFVGAKTQNIGYASTETLVMGGPKCKFK